MDEEAIYRAFGKAVADRRRQLGITQATLGVRVGLSRGSIAHIERGTQKVFLHQILALTDALELDSSHHIVPTRAVTASTDSPVRIKTFGAKNLSADQRSLISAVVESTSEKKPR